MGMKSALEPPQHRVGDVGPPIPSVAIRIRQLVLDTPKLFAIFMVLGAIFVIIAIVLIVTFLSIAAKSVVTPETEIKAFLLKYNKPFHADLLDPTSDYYQQEAAIVVHDVSQLIGAHLATSEEVTVTVHGFRNGSVVAIFSAESNTFDEDAIEDAVMEIADDPSAVIGNATVLGVEVTTIEDSGETPEGSAIAIQAEDDPEQPDGSGQTTIATTTQRMTLPTREPDPVYYAWEGDTKTWTAAKEFCESKGRMLCRSDEICVDDAPVLDPPGVLSGRRWTPTNNIANAWVYVGDDPSYVTCWTYSYAESDFPDWGETSDHPEWKQDIYCCAPETHNITYCKQIDRLFKTRSDQPHMFDYYFPGESWDLPSGMHCRCASDGYSECHSPQACYGGYLLDELFCMGQRRPFAQRCIFSYEEGRMPPGKFVTVSVQLLQTSECTECQAVGCKTWKTQWAGWGPWSSCSSPCGTGIRRRSQICPVPGECFGESSERGDCEIQPCVDQFVAPDEWSEQCLYWQNYFRRGHDAPLLIWDRSLAASAHKYGEYMRTNNVATVKHSSQGWNEDGEVYRRYGVTEMMSYMKWPREQPARERMTAENVAKNFYAEVRYYDWDNPGKKLPGYERKVIGHFTQLLWKSTRKMGCAAMKSDIPVENGNYLYAAICHYEPGGNDAWNTKEWSDEVPTFNQELICKVECAPNKCYSFTGVHTNGTTASSCECGDPTNPTCTAPCFIHCPDREWNQICYGDTECHCTPKSAVCDGSPKV